MHEILTLDRNLTLFLNGSHSLMFDGAIYMATQTLTWIPVGLLVLYIIYHNGGAKMLWMVVLMISLGIFLSDQLSSSIVKPLTARFRPANDPQLMYLVDVVNNYRGGKYGFFSAHASNTFTVAVFLMLLFRHRLTGILLMSWAALNCYTRLYLGVHYVGDILVGTFVGFVIGSLIYCFYSSRKLSYSTSPGEEKTTSSGFRVADMNVLSACILLNYCVLFIFPLF